MRTVSSIDELRWACDDARAKGLRVGLVPTMGALHAGHASLVAEARLHSSFVVASVFVNPTQFGPGEDLAQYPRALAADQRLLEDAGCALLFAPSADSIYPAGEETRVRVGRTARDLCGEHRPHHFEGVTTVLAKLFAIVGPCAACFGKKDYQQLKVVTCMIRDLFLPVEIVPVATVREPDGLALSSRNRYLSSEDRKRALALARGLSRAVAAFNAGERVAGTLEACCRTEIESVMDAVDYVTAADAETIAPFGNTEQVGERALLAAAVRVSGTRLIDNVVLGEDPAPMPAVPAARVGSGR